MNPNQKLSGEKTSLQRPVRRAPRPRALSPHEFWCLLNELATKPILRRSDWRIIKRVMRHLH